MFKKPLFQLVLVHFREFVREPAILFWSIIFPIAMAWILGIAFTSDGDQFQKAGLILNETAQNAKLRSFLTDAKPTELKETHNKAFEKPVEIPGVGKTIFTFALISKQEAEILLKRGVINLIIKEDSAKLEYHFDPKNSAAQLSYLQLSSTIENRSFESSGFCIKKLSQKGLRYIDFLVPGLVAFGIMNSALWGICYTIIDWRKRKLLRRMIAAPMRRSDFLLSIFLARIVLSFFENLLLFLFAYFYFHVPFEGSALALITVLVAGNFAFSGVSVLIASRTSNSQVGSGLINAVSMPMFFMSGIFFSYHNFPDALVQVIKWFPLTMVADSVRSIFIEGAGFEVVMLPIIILLGLGTILGGIGLKLYKWH
jgi:ABC-2 type transport system permease protein